MCPSCLLFHLLHCVDSIITYAHGHLMCVHFIQLLCAHAYALSIVYGCMCIVFCCVCTLYLISLEQNLHRLHFNTKTLHYWYIMCKHALIIFKWCDFRQFRIHDCSYWASIIDIILCNYLIYFIIIPSTYINISMVQHSYSLSTCTSLHNIIIYVHVAQLYCRCSCLLFTLISGQV